MKNRNLSGFLLTAMLGAAATLPAQAGDLNDVSLKDAPPAEHARVIWDGPYIGAHGGYGRGGFLPENAPFLDFLGTDFDQKPEGGLAGIQIGHNARRGHWVFGVEADIAATNIDGDTADSIEFLGNVFTVTETSELRYLATLRGRLGVDTGRALVYATAGIAAGKVDGTFTETFSGPAPTPALSISTSDSETHFGYVIGGGVEFPIREGVTLKGEYLYADLGTGTYESLPGVSTLKLPYDMDLHLLRFGFNYHF